MTSNNSLWSLDSMKYHTMAADASCKVAGIDDAKAATLAVYDYLVNHPDEIPPGLDLPAGTPDKKVLIKIYRYLSVQNGMLIISLDTDKANNDTEIYDFLASHFAKLQESFFMHETIATFSANTGLSCETDYYDRNGDIIDVEAILTAHFTALYSNEG